MSPKVVNLILKALDANGEAVFSREDTAAWPPGDLEEAVRIGLLERAAPATEVVCPGCEEACLEEVEFVPADKPGNTRAYIVCHRRDDIGRVNIPLATLARWSANKRVAQSLRQAVAADGARPPQEPSVSLRDFIEQHCQPLAPGRANQLAKAILKEARRKKPRLKLPATTNKAKGNQKKLFRPADLRSRWSEYQRRIANLPDLK